VPEAHKPPGAAPKKRETPQTSPRQATLLCASSSEAQRARMRATATKQQKELANALGGALHAATVLREFL